MSTIENTQDDSKVELLVDHLQAVYVDPKTGKHYTKSEVFYESKEGWPEDFEEGYYTIESEKKYIQYKDWVRVEPTFIDKNKGILYPEKMRNIIEAIRRERKYQIEKYGQRWRPISSYILLIRSELDEVEKGWNKEGDMKALEELLQVIALGVACLEDHGIVERPEITK